MNLLSRTITGTVMIILGAFLLGCSFFWTDARAISIIYGLLLFVIGLFILFNKREDEIEQIHENKKGGKNK